MSKEKIIDIFINNSDCPDGRHRTLNKYQQNKVADKLFALNEQEKKDVVKEVLQIILKCFNYWKIEQNKVDAIMTLAKEYGVEL